MPMTVPTIETVSATVERDSFLDFPTAERIMPTGPKTTGRNKNATEPKTIPQIEKVLLDGVAVTG